MLRLPYPEDEYTREIGRLVFAVGALEWLVLGALPRLAVPPALTVERLAGATTGQIAGVIEDNIHKVQDPDVVGFLAAGAAHLRVAAELRNGVLHARPASDENGKPVLYRWKPAGAPEIFLVTLEELRKRVAEVDQRAVDLDALMPAGVRD